MEERINFDFNEVLEQFRNGKNLTGKDGLLAPLIKKLLRINLIFSFSFFLILNIYNIWV